MYKRQREVIRDFIELLDIAFQNPQASIDELLNKTAIGGGVAAPLHQANTLPARSEAEFVEFTL